MAVLVGVLAGQGVRAMQTNSMYSRCITNPKTPQTQNKKNLKNKTFRRCWCDHKLKIDFSNYQHAISQRPDVSKSQRAQMCQSFKTHKKHTIRSFAHFAYFKHIFDLCSKARVLTVNFATSNVHRLNNFECLNSIAFLVITIFNVLIKQSFEQRKPLES